MFDAESRQKSDKSSNAKRKKGHTTGNDSKNRQNDAEKLAQGETEVIHKSDQELPAYVYQPYLLAVA